MKSFRKSFVATVLAGCFLCFMACTSSAYVTVTYKDSEGVVLSTEEVPSGTQYDLYYYPKTGYKVSKYTDESGNTVSGSITLNTSSVFIVYIEPISYTITFDSDLSDKSIKVPEDISCKYDEEITLPKNEIKNGTKKSAGWRSSSWNNADWTDYTYYEDEAKVTNLASWDGATVKLVANFRDGDYKVVFGAKYSSTTEVSSYKTNYYDKDEKITDIPSDPYYYGYTFKGWYDSSDSSKTIIDFETYKVSKNVTFLAKWEQFSYTITFKTDHGTAPDPLVITTSSELTYITSGIYKLSETGYEFEGWENKTGENVVAVGSAIPGYSEDIELTAKWTVWTAKLKFWSTGDGNMDDVTVTYGVEISLPKNTYTKTGYEFAGWGLSYTSDSIDYVDEEKYTWKGEKNSETVYLYSKWIDSPVYLKFYASEVSTDEDITIEYDADTYCLKAVLGSETDFVWVIDGDWSNKISSKQEISILNLSKGQHTIAVYFWGTDSYSATIVVNITE